MSSVLKKLEDRPFSLAEWLSAFAGILFIRFLFESLSSPTYSGIIPSDIYTIVHYALFFIATVLGLMCVIGYFSKAYADTGKLIVFGLPLIWLGPILDIAISRGRGYMTGYLFDGGVNLARDFLTFFGPHLTYGATMGIRIEIGFILCGIGWYIWQKTKILWRSVVGAICSYILIFLLFSLPGIVYTLSHAFSTQNNAPSIIQYLWMTIAQSNILHNTLREGVSSVSGIRLLELTFDKFASQILFIISIAFLSVWFWKISKKKLTTVIKNCRVERIIFYLLLLSFGIGYALLKGYGHFVSWIDCVSILCLTIAWCAAWLHAVHENDIADISIDTISNRQRPLIEKTLSEKEMREFGHIFLGISLLGSWLAGFYAFFMDIAFIAAYHIYSTYPLRLKRVPLLSSFLISTACLSTVLAGFFFTSADKKISYFPISVALGIIVVFTLVANIRDLKDTEGDAREGIRTLPVIFKENGFRVVGWLFALGILLIPVFFSFYTLYLTALPTAVIGYRLIAKKPYKEKSVFVLGLLFFLCSLIFI